MYDSLRELLQDCNCKPGENCGSSTKRHEAMRFEPGYITGRESFPDRCARCGELKVARGPDDAECLCPVGQ